MKSLLLLLLSSAFAVQASQADIDVIENAAMNLNSQELIKLAEQYQGYEQALAHYRLAISENLQGLPEQANHHLDLAISTLETLTEQLPSDDEAWVLLAQVYGLKVAYQPIKGMYYGPKAQFAIDRGLKLNKANPRAYLVQGISAYNTPSMFGGSKSRALQALDRAVELYPQDASTLSWGNAEAYVWRGLAQLSSDNKVAALADFQAALAIAPNYGWAQMLLNNNQ